MPDPCRANAPTPSETTPDTVDLVFRAYLWRFTLISPPALRAGVGLPEWLNHSEKGWRQSAWFVRC